MATDTTKIAQCPICEGTGWKTAPTDRKVRSVTRCDCRLTARGDRLLAQAEIPAQYAHCTLEDFDVAFPSATDSLGRALLYARKFVEEYPLERAGMLLSGPCGTGKTHLAAAILRELMMLKGARGLFRGYSALLKQIQATYSKQVVADEETGVVLTEYSILQDVIQADVLVLDDLGAEKSSEWTLSLLYHVINERYNNRRTTVITTNLPWDSLPSPSSPPSRRNSLAQDVMRPATLRDRISERTYSRITEMCPIKIELHGKDYRTIRGSR